MIPKGEQGTRDRREETVTGAGAMVRTGGTTSTGMGTRQRIVMGARTRAGTGVETGARIRSRIDKRVEGRECLGIYELVIRVGRKTREGGRRQRVASNHSRKARRPFETVASCRGQDRGEWRRGN